MTATRFIFIGLARPWIWDIHLWRQQGDDHEDSVDEWRARYAEGTDPRRMSAERELEQTRLIRIQLVNELQKWCAMDDGFWEARVAMYTSLHKTKAAQCPSCDETCVKVAGQL